MIVRDATATQTGLSIDPQLKTMKARRRDLDAIIRHTAELDRLFTETAAGREVSASIPSHRIPPVHDTVRAIHRTAMDAKYSMTPPARGRTPSPERQGRVTLIANLMHEAFQAGAYPGTGQTGPFAELVGEVYEALKVGEDRNLSRDLRDAANLLRQKGDSG